MNTLFLSTAVQVLSGPPSTVTKAFKHLLKRDQAYVPLSLSPIGPRQLALSADLDYHSRPIEDLVVLTGTAAEIEKGLRKLADNHPHWKLSSLVPLPEAPPEPHPAPNADTSGKKDPKPATKKAKDAPKEADPLFAALCVRQAP